MIHELSDVKTAEIGSETKVWQYSVILENARIGNNCNINCHVFIENDVIIGDNVTIKSGVYVWNGIVIEDDVFIGPNVTFTNDKRPRSKQYADSFLKTVIKRNASVGAASIILGGIEIGEYAMVGAGSLVTKSIPARALVMGNPAKITGWLNEDGTKMNIDGDHFLDNKGAKWIVKNNNLIQL